MAAWFENFLNVHHRMMARFLRKRGWVVFYLEKEHRSCTKGCWLDRYRAEEKEWAKGKAKEKK